MRVTLLCNGFAEYVMGLANALTAHAEVTVIHPFALTASCTTLASPAVQLRSFQKPPRRRNIGNVKALRHAFRLVRESRPDILHVQEFFDYTYDFFTLFVQLPPLVTTIHDVVPHPGDGQASPGLQYTKAFGCWRSARLIVHTNGMRAQLAGRFRICPDRIDVISHGELGSLYQQLARAAGVLPPSRHPYTLLFFGRIWPYKGLRYLLEAFAIVKREVPEAKLLICGRGGDLDRHAALIANLPDVEVRKQFIPEQAVGGLFEQSSIVVLPYIEASQSGVSATAFTTGAVVVASRVGGLADQIIDEETGILVEPGNSFALSAVLIRLLKDQKLQQQIRQKAHEFGSGELSWSYIADKTMETYERSVRERR